MKVQVGETEERVEKKPIYKTLCDFCGIEENDWEDVASKEINCGNHPCQDTTVNMHLSNSWPECGTTRHWNLDCCPRCFMGKIVPLVQNESRSYGEETDW